MLQKMEMTVVLPSRPTDIPIEMMKCKIAHYLKLQCRPQAKHHTFQTNFLVRYQWNTPYHIDLTYLPPIATAKHLPTMVIKGSLLRISLE